MLLATYTLWLRDVVRFVRQRSRILGALGSPVVFWLLIGSGLGRSFQSDASVPLAGGYLEYFFPGTLALVVLFTAIFSTISIIEDRHEGFLQGVLVAPVPRASIALGKMLGGTTLALGQAALFLLLAPLAEIPLRAESLPVLALVVTLVAFGLTGLGFLIAWHLDSTQGFHAVMNLFLIPMWILSGALFPAEGARGWVRALMTANPLTYGVAAIRAILYEGATAAAGDPSLTTSFGVITAFAAAVLAAGVLSVARESRRAQ
jgi:ABC-2 type transport system permease protein